VNQLAAPSVFGSRAHDAMRALISGTSRAVITMDMAEPSLRQSMRKLADRL
jgi:hypothetical protein